MSYQVVALRANPTSVREDYKYEKKARQTSPRLLNRYKLTKSADHNRYIKHGFAELLRLLSAEDYPDTDINV